MMKCMKKIKYESEESEQVFLITIIEQKRTDTSVNIDDSISEFKKNNKSNYKAIYLITYDEFKRIYNDTSDNKGKEIIDRVIKDKTTYNATQSRNSNVGLGLGVGASGILSVPDRPTEGTNNSHVNSGAGELKYTKAVVLGEQRIQEIKRSLTPEQLRAFNIEKKRKQSTSTSITSFYKKYLDKLHSVFGFEITGLNGRSLYYFDYKKLIYVDRPSINTNNSSTYINTSPKPEVETAYLLVDFKTEGNTKDYTIKKIKTIITKSFFTYNKNNKRY